MHVPLSCMTPPCPRAGTADSKPNTKPVHNKPLFTLAHTSLNSHLFPLIRALRSAYPTPQTHTNTNTNTNTGAAAPTPACSRMWVDVVATVVTEVAQRHILRVQADRKRRHGRTAATGTPDRWVNHTPVTFCVCVCV